MAKKSGEPTPFEAVSAAYDTFKQKEAEKVAADATYHDAVQTANAQHDTALASAKSAHDAVVNDFTAALQALREVQGTLNEMLGNAVANPRFRQSA